MPQIDSDAVVVDGPRRLDVASAHAYRQQLLEALRTRPSRLVVDLRRVAVFDSAGAGVLVGAHRRLAAAGGRLVITNATEAVAAHLRRTGLVRLLTER